VLKTVGHFDEIRVIEGVAERTGTIVDRSTLRGGNRRMVCASVRELARKVRHEGDGYFYLAAGAWPEDTSELDLKTKWKTMAG
jgi:hypothetical protein